MNYKPLYYHLFNVLTDALNCLDSGDISKAKEILIAAQQETEEMYISAEPEEQALQQAI